MTLTPETMIGVMAVLLLMAVGMLLILSRGLRSRKLAKAVPEKTSEPALADDGAHEPVSADLAREQLGDDLTAQAERSRLSAVLAPSRRPAPHRAGLSTGPSIVDRQRQRAQESGAALLMEVWQTTDGSLEVEMDGKRYRRLLDIRDGRVGRRLLDTINRLNAFSKGAEASSVATSMPTTTAPARSMPPAASERYANEESQVFFEDLGRQTEARPKVARITADPVPLRRRSPPKESGITLNLAKEVERLLQIRVNASPEFRQRYIHVTSAPDGGLRIDVDGVRYGAVDEIPERRVQELIRATIAEWEVNR